MSILAFANTDGNQVHHLRIPRFQVQDDSYIDVSENKSEVADAIAGSSLSEHAAEVSVYVSWSIHISTLTYLTIAEGEERLVSVLVSRLDTKWTTPTRQRKTKPKTPNA